ncbi:DNA repair protein rad50, partial [Conglomerata obtusa]
MTRLVKLMLRGIRSYNPNASNTIEFASPLTLIVGQNGSGKTTIIEALKFVCTNDLPQNSRGGAFIYDPKLLQQTDVKAQVKLKFVNVNEMEMVCTRSLQATQKKSLLSQKSIDSTLLYKEKDKDVSISNRCVNIDNEMQHHMGVTSAILQNVIFCHQEESNWILSEPGNVKKKLDDIFATSKYTKALESFKTLKKDTIVKLKMKNHELEFLNENKLKKEKLEKNLVDTYEKINDINRNIIKCEDIELDQKISTLKSEIVLGDELEGQRLKLCINIENLERKNFGNVKTFSLEKLQEFYRKLNEKTNDEDEKISILNTHTEIYYNHNNYNMEYFINNFKQFELKSYMQRHENNIVKLKSELFSLTNQLKTYENTNIKLNNLYVQFNDLCCHLNRLKEKEDDIIKILSDKYRIRNIYEINDFILKLTDCDEIVVLEHKSKNVNSCLIDTENLHKKTTEEQNDNLFNEKTFVYQLTQNQKDLDKIESQLINLSKTNFKENESEIYEKEIQLEENLELLEIELNTIYKNSEKIQALEIQKKEKNEYFDSICINQKDIKNSLKNTKPIFLETVVNENLLTEQLNILCEEVRNIDETKIENNLEKLFDDFYNFSDKFKNYYETVNAKFYESTILIKNINYELEDLKKLKEVNNLYDIIIMQSCEDDLSLEKEITQYRESISLANNACVLYHNFLKKGIKNNACYICKKTFLQNDINSYADNIKKIIDTVPINIEEKKNKLLELEKKLVSHNKTKTTNTNCNHHIEKIRLIIIKLYLINHNNKILKFLYQLCSNNGMTENHKQSYDKILQIPIEKFFKYLDNSKSSESLLVIKESFDCIINTLRTTIELKKKYNCVVIYDLDKTRSIDIVLRDIETIKKEIFINRKKIEQHQEMQNMLKNGHSFETLTIRKVELVNIISQINNNVITCQKNINAYNENLRKLEETRQNYKKELNIIESEINNLRQKNNLQIQELRNYTKSNCDLNNEKAIFEKQMLDLKNKFYDEINKLFINDEKTNKKQKLFDITDEENKENENASNFTFNITSIIEQGQSNLTFEMQNEIKKCKVIEEHYIEKTSVLNKQIDLAEEELKAFNNDFLNILKYLDKLENEKLINDYKNKLKELNVIDLKEKKIKLEELEKIKKIKNDKKCILQGECKQLKNLIDSYNNDLKHDFNDIILKYTNCYIEIKTLSLILEDIDKCIKAFDKSIVEFHTYKIEEVNYILKDLWINTYKGNDIDYIELKSETSDNKMYNYKVVMFKNGVELDLRGRCSAGQKVLCSILMRLALSDAFSAGCSIMALDEPTTNLDKENIEALAMTLKGIIEKRKENKDFQLILITHDENFVEIMCRDDCEYFYQIVRDNNGDSKILMKT